MKLEYLYCSSSHDDVHKFLANNPLYIYKEGLIMETKENDLHPLPSTIEEVVERAAKHLPKGYIVSIQVDKDGYKVILEKPDCSTKVDGGDGIRSDINEAICLANGFIN